MKESSRYIKIVEWSTKDNVFIGSCPNLFYGGCHGPDEIQVFNELCQLVNETIEVYRQDGIPLPTPTSGKDLVNELQHHV